MFILRLKRRIGHRLIFQNSTTVHIAMYTVTVRPSCFLHSQLFCDLLQIDGPSFEEQSINLLPSLPERPAGVPFIAAWQGRVLRFRHYRLHCCMGDSIGLNISARLAEIRGGYVPFRAVPPPGLCPLQGYAPSRAVLSVKS